MVQRRRSGVSAQVAALLALLLVWAFVGPVIGAAAAGEVGTAGIGGKNPGAYRNPLQPEIPGDGMVESCADPTVIRGQEPGDSTWYMYCTTDPLNDEDLDATGSLRFHRVPTLTSQDLVTWTYVGDAFSGLPSWAEPDAALWAPEVVYSTAFHQYYMFYGVTDTTAAVSGVDNCANDNAIGVATSDSPTGPWEFSDDPVVGPRSAGAGCNFLWTYDPDVLGDAVGAKSILYYGSYFGGVFGTHLTLTADGATADQAGAVMVAIDNKYEGTNVVFKDGFYYMFLSATNCCNGALTGYSVFVGRSASPLGPFRDQQGNLLTAAQAGGTPFLTMNGNRWVGTGHNTVFTDADGDWWTVYHAVDQQDPFFETAAGFTKRPPLLDAIAWVNGWPTVNGGSGPSDTRMPAPAGQPGEASRARSRVAKTQAPHKRLSAYSDEFSGSALDAAWSWQSSGSGATPRPPSNSVGDGILRVQIQAADLFVDVNNAAVLVREAPRGDYVVDTKVRVSVPDDGCCYNYAQAGVLAYQNADNYVKLTNTSIWNTRQTEFAKEIKPVPTGWARYGNTVVGPPSPEWTYLRIAVERLTGSERASAGGDTESYTAYTSQDGVKWVRGGTWTHSLADAAQIGLAAFGLQDGAQTFTAEFDYVRVSTLKKTSLR
ncbi:MAG TPA: family 43 glycosylhydrolase [Propionibacteriaceae bacterium]|nr:family 43 glycosylhydrolase [Propionibacteriaceae bacterium]